MRELFHDIICLFQNVVSDICITNMKTFPFFPSNSTLASQWLNTFAEHQLCEWCFTATAGAEANSSQNPAFMEVCRRALPRHSFLHIHTCNCTQRCTHTHTQHKTHKHSKHRYMCVCTHTHTQKKNTLHNKQDLWP